MEKKFKLLKILIIIIIIIICVLLFCYFAVKKKSNSSFGNTVNNTPTDTTPIEVKKDIQEVNARDIYYIIKEEKGLRPRGLKPGREGGDGGKGKKP